MITVAIPAYGNQDLLDITLRTIGWQDYKFDTLVIDDGSDPPLIVPDWVRLHRIDRLASHRSAATARNKCFELAETEWVFAIDSSILLGKGLLKALMFAVEFLGDVLPEDNPIQMGTIITLHARFVEERMDPQDEVEMERLYQDHLFTDKRPVVRCNDHTAVLMKRSTWETVGGYDEENFKAWGLEGQDFGHRAEDAGFCHLSFIPRRPNELLYVLHNPHDAPRDKDIRNQEWIDKWGRPFSEML